MTAGGRGRIAWARWAFGLVAASVVLAVLSLLFAPRPVPVDVQPVRRGLIQETVSDQGYARVRDAYVVAAPVGGRLQRIPLKVGDPVRAGITVVARIRPASPDLLDPRARRQSQAAVLAADAAVTAGQAEVDRLAAEARQAEGDLARVRTLHARGFAAAQALETAQARARAGRAAVEAARAQVRVRQAEAVAARAAMIGPEVQGAQTILVASPASGAVTRVFQPSEQTVSAGTPLIEVSDRAGLEAAVEFLSQDAVRIREGMLAEIYDWGGEGALPALVRRVEPQGYTKVSALGVEEQRALVLLQLTGDPARWSALGPGYRVWGRVVLRRSPYALKAPVGALVRHDEGWAVFRIAKGRARLTSIRVGALTDREAEVLAGLSSADQLVVFPSDQVADGVRVRSRNKD